MLKKAISIIMTAIILMISPGCAATMPVPRVASPSMELLTTSTGARYHWRLTESQRIKVILNKNNLSNSYLIAIQQAVRFWNNKIGKDVLVIRFTGEIDFIPGAISIYRAQLDSEQTAGGPNLVGQTVLGGDKDTGEISGAVILLDASLLPEHVAPTVIHEIGHALALAHDEDDENSLMFPYMWSATRQQITAEDISAVRSQFILNQ